MEQHRLWAAACGEEEILCPHRPRCIHYAKKCDGVDDCGDGWDEQGCASQRTAGTAYEMVPERVLNEIRAEENSAGGVAEPGMGVERVGGQQWEGKLGGEGVGNEVKWAKDGGNHGIMPKVSKLSVLNRETKGQVYCKEKVENQMGKNPNDKHITSR